MIFLFFLPGRRLAAAAAGGFCPALDLRLLLVFSLLFDFLICEHTGPEPNDRTVCFISVQYEKAFRSGLRIVDSL
jgi:hypothetical protein